MGQNFQAIPLWPLVLYFGLVILTVVGMLALSYVLGEHHMERGTGEPYESGITTTGSPRIRFDVKYYLIAMFFVIFDLESIFVFAWAIALRESGWRGYIEIMIFIGILLAALGYLWRLGALEWAELQRKNMRAYKTR
ncbi:MAG: NADH-quinone oxidoreductase subunit A [Deltaproteobacteria bacterium]|jgi:NADH-quinone oxidoreductase subunit A